MTQLARDRRASAACRSGRPPSATRSDASGWPRERVHRPHGRAGPSDAAPDQRRLRGGPGGRRSPFKPDFPGRLGPARGVRAQAERGHRRADDQAGLRRWRRYPGVETVPGPMGGGGGYVYAALSAVKEARGLSDARSAARPLCRRRRRRDRLQPHRAHGRAHRLHRRDRRLRRHGGGRHRRDGGRDGPAGRGCSFAVTAGGHRHCLATPFPAASASPVAAASSPPRAWPTSSPTWRSPATARSCPCMKPLTSPTPSVAAFPPNCCAPPRAAPALLRRLNAVRRHIAPGMRQAGPRTDRPGTSSRGNSTSTCERHGTAVCCRLGHGTLARRKRARTRIA